MQVAQQDDDDLSYLLGVAKVRKKSSTINIRQPRLMNVKVNRIFPAQYDRTKRLLWHKLQIALMISREGIHHTPDSRRQGVCEG